MQLICGGILAEPPMLAGQGLAPAYYLFVAGSLAQPQVLAGKGLAPAGCRLMCRAEGSSLPCHAICLFVPDSCLAFSCEHTESYSAMCRRLN